MSSLDFEIKQLVRKSIAENMPVEKENHHASLLANKYVNLACDFLGDRTLVKTGVLGVALFSVIYKYIGIGRFMQFSGKIVEGTGNVVDFIKRIPERTVKYLKKYMTDFSSTVEYNNKLVADYKNTADFIVNFYDKLTNSQGKFKELISANIDQVMLQKDDNKLLNICNNINLVIDENREECKNELAAFRELLVTEHREKFSHFYNYYDISRLFSFDYMIPQNKSDYMKYSFQRYTDMHKADFFKKEGHEFPTNWFERYKPQSEGNDLKILETGSNKNQWNDYLSYLTPYLTPFTDYRTLLALGALGLGTYYAPTIGNTIKSGYDTTSNFIYDTYSNIRDSVYNYFHPEETEKTDSNNEIPQVETPSQSEKVEHNIQDIENTPIETYSINNLFNKQKNEEGLRQRRI